MRRIKVVADSRLPMRSPLMWTVVAWMGLDYYQPSGVTRGVVYAVMGLLWVAYIASIFTEEQADPFAKEITYTKERRY